MWMLGIELGSSLRAVLLATEPPFQSPEGVSYIMGTILALEGPMDRETEAGVVAIGLAPVETAGFALRGEITHLAPDAIWISLVFSAPLRVCITRHLILPWRVALRVQ